jgi:hypothetical protein
MGRCHHFNHSALIYEASSAHPITQNLGAASWYGTPSGFDKTLHYLGG